jgi:hypothetical protein
MCGENNPDNLDVCKYCDARLKPLISPSTPEEPRTHHETGAKLPEWSHLGWQDDPDSKEPFSLDSDDPNEWLNRIRAVTDPDEVPTIQQTIDTSSDSPEPSDEGDDDWLQRIRTLHQTNLETESADSTAQPFDGISPLSPSDSDLEDEKLFADESEVPEWLARINDRYTGDEDVKREDKAAKEEALPDWINGDQIAQEVQLEKPEAAPISQEPGEEIPDWLAEVGTKSDPGDLETEEPIPDWLSKFTEKEQSVPAAVDTPGDTIPEWLSDIGIDSGSIENEIKALSPELGKIEEPESTDDGALEKWFSELDESAGPIIEPLQESTEDMPGWLKSLGTVVSGTIKDDSIPDIDDGAISPFVTPGEFDDDLLNIESLPNWLTPESGIPDAVQGTTDSNLTPADLPGWLAAIRPVGEGTPELPKEDDTPESAGPLAGLRNILSAEPEIAQFKNPPIYSTKLQVTSTQQAHADIFQALISIEGKAEPIPEPPLVSSQRAFRWLIALFLTIVIGFIVISGNQTVPLPNKTLIPDSTYAAYRTINALPNQAPVLIAFDYEPGTAGEMHAAAAALVSNLMEKRMRLALVSTLPTGPAVAEYFIKTTQGQHMYSSETQYINLGYIPGGAAGLLSFAQTPQWVFPLSFDHREPWETVILQDINSLSDFALVLVITNDPDTARSWIEQIKPRIGNTPLLTVVSAQAEPMVRPYFGKGNNAQVRGIISGLTGGVAYEVAVGKENLASAYWDAFSVGLILAVGVILIGGTVNLIQLLLAQSKSKKQGAVR